MDFYLLYKALHLISVISWFAGLLYLPRLYFYHSETNNDNTKETFITMEKRLFFYIMNPAMFLSWLFGALLIYSIGFQNFSYLWLKLKLLTVSLLTCYHLFLFMCLKSFSLDSNTRSSRFYRILNEVPTVLLIVIIFIVVYKPL
jgi:putative membrane protein